MSNQTPISAIDNLTSAVNSHIIPNQEYLLQGSVIDASAAVLLHRLRGWLFYMFYSLEWSFIDLNLLLYQGLCDAAESGPETFHDHEMCFSLNSSKFTIVPTI